jgi:cytochrome c5
MKLRIVSLSLAGVLLYACSPKVVPVVTEVKAPPTPPPTPKTEVTVLSAELAEGKSLYENNCAKCHELYDTKRFNGAQWSPILYRMQKEAGISDAEREKIYNYVIAK